MGVAQHVKKSFFHYNFYERNDRSSKVQIADQAEKKCCSMQAIFMQISYEMLCLRPVCKSSLFACFFYDSFMLFMSSYNIIKEKNKTTASKKQGEEMHVEIYLASRRIIILYIFILFDAESAV